MPSAMTCKGEEIEYIDLHEEPMHPCKFHNEYVWVFKACMLPGEKCLWHKHSEHTFFIALTDIHAKMQSLDKEFDLCVDKLHKWWTDYKSKPEVHTGYLAKECPKKLNILGVEVLNPPTIFCDSHLENFAYILNDPCSNSRARIYDMKLDAGQSTGMHKWNFCGIVISLSDVTLHSEHPKCPFSLGHLKNCGDFQWFEGPIEFSVKNIGNEVFTAVLIELLK